VLKGTTYALVGTNVASGQRVYKTVSKKAVWVTPEGGGNGRNIIDRNKIRIQVRFLFGALRIGLDEDNFVGEASKYKKGPVRSVIRQWVGFKLPLRLHNLSTPKFFLDVYLYDTMAIIAATTNWPIDPGYIITDLKLLIGYDLQDPDGYGMQWYNSNNRQGFLADGVTSPMEAEYDDGPDTWRCIVGPNGWMMHGADWDKEYYEQADIRIQYRDDIESYSPPEYFPGDLGHYNTLSTMRHLKPKSYKFQLEWYFPYNFYDPDGLRLDIIDQLMNMKEEPLVIKVGCRQATNKGILLSAVEP
jgi:hypothetical protein